MDDGAVDDLGLRRRAEDAGLQQAGGGSTAGGRVGRDAGQGGGEVGRQVIVVEPGAEAVAHETGRIGAIAAALDQADVARLISGTWQ